MSYPFVPLPTLSFFYIDLQDLLGENNEPTVSDPSFPLHGSINCVASFIFPSNCSTSSFHISKFLQFFTVESVSSSADP